MKKLIIFTITLIVISLNGHLNLNNAYAAVIQIAAGDYHTIGLEEDNTVVAVGSNVYGQIDLSSWTNISQIAAGGFHTVGLTANGRVEAVGLDNHDQTDVSSWRNIIQIDAGLYQTIGLEQDGTVVAVGYNDDGKLNVSSWASIIQFATGRNHTAGVKENGTVVAVGSNDDGQLNVTSWRDITQVAVGMSYTVGLQEDGEVVGVGINDKGQLNVSSWTNIKQIVARESHTIGLKEDGTVVSAGSNLYGQRNVSSWTNIKQIATGRYHTVGLKEDGTVMAVGSNNGGQLDVSPLNPGINTYYPDSDGDGYGDGDNPIEALTLPSGYVDDNTDCNDMDAGIHPGADEIAWDGIDQDCNGSDLESLTTYYYDYDGDGYGNPDISYQGITLPYAYTTDNTDCNDMDADVHPNAQETAGDGIDQDCNGSDLPILITYYSDSDGDGYGDPGNSIESSTQPSGYVEDNTDCNDQDAGVHPNAQETAGDGIDQDCDGADMSSLTTYYSDMDGDGYGDPDNSMESASLPSGYVTDNTDCNDDDSSIYPGAAEQCNGEDNNCNQIIDECCDGIPGQITLISPSGTIEETVTEFVWKEDPCATLYKIYVQNSLNNFKFSQWYEIADNDDDYPEVNCQDGECSIILDSVLESDEYEWFVMGSNDSGGDGSWSSGMDFIVQGDDSPPSMAVLVSPLDVVFRFPGENTVTFTWNGDDKTAWYRLAVWDREDNTIHSQWYESSKICSEGSCSVTPASAFEAMEYQWWVESWNEFGSVWTGDGTIFTAK